MKIEGMTLLVAGALFATSCTKAPPPSPSTPAPVATPHPATGAKEAAVRLYPDLAKKDSTFYRTFLEVFEERRKKSPNSVATVDWPLDVAHRTAAILNVAPVYATPAPATPAAVGATPRPPNALERGAYDQRRMRQPPVRDQNGNRVPPGQQQNF